MKLMLDRGADMRYYRFIGGEGVRQIHRFFNGNLPTSIPTNKPRGFSMATHTYASLRDFKEENNFLYKRLTAGSHSGFWDYGANSLSNEGSKVLTNPHLLTDAQWRWFAHRSLAHLKDSPIRELIQGFRYEQDNVWVGNEKYIVPNGNISGSLQGMYLFIEPDGRAHS